LNIREITAISTAQPG